MKRASPMRRSCSTRPAARRPATSPKAAARRRHGTAMCAGRRRRSRKRRRRRGAGSTARARRAIRCWSRQRSAPARSRMRASSRMPRWRASMATAHRARLDAGGVPSDGADRQALQARHDKVRVIADHVGGGFGSKASFGVETIAAIELARAAKAPVRVAFDRHEELSVTGYRPAAEMKIALLPSADGALKALSLTAHADTGAATNSTIAALARLIYPAEAKGARRLRRHQQSAARCAVPRARRAADGVRAGAGDRRSRAADEGRSDRACANAGIPIPTASGFTTGRRGSTSGATARTPASQTGRYRRGVGVATGYWLYLWQPGSKVEVAVKGGRLIASTATQDIGTGSRTVIANTVAREFGLEPHEVEVRIGDSNLPEGPGSGGSRVTASVIPPTLLAIQKLKAAIEQNAKRKPVPGSNAPWREMLAASPDLTASGVRPEDSKQTAPGIDSPLKQVGFMGMDLRLDDAPLLQHRDRRRRAEFGAGDRGRGRYLARPCPRPQRPYRHCGRQDRGARAGAQPGGGLGDPGHRLRAL